jgi:hypothetical protein
MVNAGGYKMSLVGAGVSQGASEHFLIKYDNVGTAQYYCLQAGATEDDLRNATYTNQTDALAGACNTYVAIVDALTPYDVNDATQIPNIDLSSFDLGVTGTPVKYLMFSLD